MVLYVDHTFPFVAVVYPGHVMSNLVVADPSENVDIYPSIIVLVLVQL